MEAVHKKYKVAFVTNIPSPYRVGFFEYLATHASFEFEVLYCSHNEKDRDWAVEFGKGYKYSILRRVGLMHHYHLNPGVISLMASRRYDVAVIWGYGYPTVVLAIATRIIRKKRWIFLSDGGFVRKENAAKRLLKKFVISRADAYIVAGTLAEKHLISYGADKKKIINGYLTCDVEYFSREVAAQRERIEDVRNGLPLHGLKILYVGQLIERKGIDLLLEAYKSANCKEDLSLIIAGEGPLRHDLEEFVSINRLRGVSFVGFAQSDELPVYYGIADILVLPSREDIWGLVVNEAMACGLPVIVSSKVGSAYDLVKEGYNGFIFSSEDVEELKKEIEFFYRNKGAISRFSRNSKEIISCWTFKESAEGFNEAIRIACAQK